MATVKDKSGNSPIGERVEDHVKSKQEIIISLLEDIKTNTSTP